MIPSLRRVTNRTVIGACLALAAAGPAAGQGVIGGWVAEIRARVSAGDATGALRLADSALAVQPAHPSLLYAHASALVAAGRDAAARTALEPLVRRDPRRAQRVLQDSALARVAGLFDGADIAARAERAAQPIARASVWATLGERDLVPEGTAWDGATRSVLVGSLNKAKVVAIAEDGSVRDRVPSGRAGLGSVVGIHVDARRSVLWVASNPRYDQPADTATPSLFAFDAATGEFRSRHPAPGGGAAHFLNDLTTGPDGSVYVTDGRASRVHVLSPGANGLRELTELGPLQGPNGITISDDGRHLFVADGAHIRVLALDGSGRWTLAVPDTIDVTGIDGLAFADNALIAHHPLAFWRIVRYPLDAGRRSVTGHELLEANTPDARTSTTGEVVDGAYVFIGNGQLDRMNAGTIDSAGMDPVRMYRISLAPAPPGRVLVALSEVDSVAVFDALSLERLATWPAGSDPHEIAAHPDGRRAYVADAGATSVTVLESAPEPRLSGTWSLPDGIQVHDLAVSADGRTVWAVSGAQSALLELDAGNGRVLRRIPIERPGGWMVAVDGPSGAVVVANLEGGAITLFDPRTAATRILPAETGLIDAASPAGSDEIWAVNASTGHLTVHETRTGRLRSLHSDGPSASRVLFTPDGRSALIAMSEPATLVSYDVATNRRNAVLELAAAPKVLALSRDGRRAYVSHPSGALTLVDVPSMTVLRTVTLAGTPDGVAVLDAAGPAR